MNSGVGNERVNVLSEVYKGGSENKRIEEL